MDPSEIMSTSTCWSRLRDATVGRLAFVHGGTLQLFPVNYAVDQGSVVFRTSAESPLSTAVGEQVVFEVDGLADEGVDAWSVVIRGVAHQVSGTLDVESTVDVPVFPWHGAPKPRFIRIEALEVTGRQFHVVDPSTWSPKVP